MGALIRFGAICIFCMVLASCATSGGTFCDISKPIRLAGQSVDAMTEAEVGAALAHNRKGQRLCGWKP